MALREVGGLRTGDVCCSSQLSRSEPPRGGIDTGEGHIWTFTMRDFQDKRNSSTTSFAQTKNKSKKRHKTPLLRTLCFDFCLICSTLPHSLVALDNKICQMAKCVCPYLLPHWHIFKTRPKLNLHNLRYSSTRSHGPVYLSQSCGSGSWPLLLRCSERELCQIWTSCSSPYPSLCWSLLETGWTALGSHTQKKTDRQQRMVNNATQTDWRHHTHDIAVCLLSYQLENAEIIFI